MISIAERLIELRTSQGIRQTDLAERLGISKQVLSSYEISHRLPSYKNLIKIAKHFNVTTDYLLGVDNQPSKYINVETLSSSQINAIYVIIDEFKNNK